MGLPWNYHRTAMGLPWDHHGIAPAIMAHGTTGTLCLQLPPPRSPLVSFVGLMASQEHWGEVPSWGAMEAGGNAHPIVPEHTCVRRDVQPGACPQGDKGHQVPRAPRARDLAKPEPGQFVWKGCRRRAGYFSFFLGTDWFKFVSQ